MLSILKKEENDAGLITGFVGSPFSHLSEIFLITLKPLEREYLQKVFAFPIPNVYRNFYFLSSQTLGVNPKSGIQLRVPLHMLMNIHY